MLDAAANGGVRRLKYGIVGRPPRGGVCQRFIAGIIRSRDPAVIESGDIVVDVGGVYDVTRRRFDHHQREFTETLTPKHKTKLSSAGLVYRYVKKT